MSNQNLKPKALELKSQGLSYQQIADELGIGKTTAHTLINSDPNGKESNVHSSDKKGDIEKLKMDIKELKDAILKNNGNASVELELRKLEMDQDYRMEQLENKRTDDILRKNIDDLNVQVQSLQGDSDHSKNEIRELSILKNELSDENKILQITNSELEDELDMLQDPTVVSFDAPVDISIPTSFIKRLKKLLNEYLAFDGNDCNIVSIEVIQEQLNELKPEINELAKLNNYDHNNNGAIVVIDKFLEDLDELLACFDEEDEDELEISMNEDWKEEMEEWLAATE